jgi:cob(I)alamin adenosyltransferase
VDSIKKQKIKKMIHILTGEGAGKTTSSIGHLIRAIGQDGRGLIIQFYKNFKNAGDYKFFFEKHPATNVDIIQYGVKCLNKKAREENKCYQCGKCMEDQSLLRRRVLSAIKKVEENAKFYDSIVLDEILVAYSFGHISMNEIKNLVSLAPQKEWYLTGRLFGCGRCDDYLLKCHYKDMQDDPNQCNLRIKIIGSPRAVPLWIYKWADYITNMEEIKHPFKKGIEARIGVEW